MGSTLMAPRLPAIEPETFLESTTDLLYNALFNDPAVKTDPVTRRDLPRHCRDQNEAVGLSGFHESSWKKFLQPYPDSDLHLAARRRYDAVHPQVLDDLAVVI